MSFDDQEIGFQTRHSVPTVPVVIEQLTTSNPLAATSVSRNGVAKAFDGFTIKLLSQLGFSLALRQPNDAGEDRNDGDDSAADGEKLDHFTAFFAA